MLTCSLMPEPAKQLRCEQHQFTAESQPEQDKMAAFEIQYSNVSNFVLIGTVQSGLDSYKQPAFCLTCHQQTFQLQTENIASDNLAGARSPVFRKYLTNRKHSVFKARHVYQQV